ncbi:alpha-2-macroglobulin family protein [Luteitalea pratensis]|nr:MG2 domain-containing protein [Luteitalea pratensis]
MHRPRLRPGVTAFLLVLVMSMAGIAGAQEQTTPVRPADRPAFSLSSGEIFTSTSSPYITLTFERLGSLDFRIYRVADPVAFFAGLDDAHTLGSGEYTVPTEQTWLERLASWKAGRRADLQSFLRRQVSREYRAQRRAGADKATVQRRVQLGLTAYAQVPLLNDRQVVASWREILPRLADTDVRRIPIEVKRPGVYLVEAVTGTQLAYTILMVSDVALVTKVAPGTMLVYTVDRTKGQPVAGCGVAAIADKVTLGTATTDARGLATIPLGDVTADDLITVGHCGEQAVASTPPTYGLQSNPRRELVAHVFTDRPVYRPGHTVKAKAILRWRTGMAIEPFDQQTVEMAISDRTGRVIHRVRRDVDAFGAVDTEVALPASAALGIYTVEVASGDAKATGSFDVQEYRKPEFEVSVTPGVALARQGQTIDVTVNARYYFGQPVRNAEVRLVVQAGPYYSPLRWVDSESEDENEDGYFYGGDELDTLTATLDAQGQARFKVPLPESETSSDLQVRFEARIKDASDLEVTGSGLAVATWGDYLIAARATPSVARPGTPIDFRVRAVDYRGSGVVGIPVTVQLVRTEWDSNTQQQRREVLTSGNTTTGADGRATWQTRAPESPGSYLLEARAMSGTRAVIDNAYLWVPGATEETYTSGGEVIELVTDKSTYAPGDTAKVAVRGVAPATPVLLTKEARTLTWYDLRQPSSDGTFDVPVTDGDLGDTWVNLLYLKDDKVYYAEKKVRVPATGRAVKIEVTADKAIYRPGEPGVYSLRTLDAAGSPVQAQVALGVVDEAVYGVRKDTTADPLRVFYRTEYSRVTTDYSRQYYFMGYSGTLRLKLAQRRRPLSLADFKGDTPERPQVRKNFPDAIYWSPSVVTGLDGTATVKVDYPDSLTTWRLTARAVTRETQVGMAVARTITTRDLLLRIVAPRFLTERDEVRVPAIVHNYKEGGALPVTVAMTAAGLESRGGAPTTLTVPTGGEARTEWAFGASAPGSATFTGTVTAAGGSDAMALTIPVHPFGARRDVGVSGSVAAGASRTVDLAIPEATNPNARSVVVSLMPSMAGSLLGALDELVNYPYGCTEQTVSSFVPNLLVMRTLDQLKLAPTERMSMLDRVSRAGLARLLRLQHENGGWGWWRTDDDHPFMTAYALYGLLEARAASIEVPSAALQNGTSALARQLVETPAMVPELKAYAAYVLARAAAADAKPEQDGFDAAALVTELWGRRTDMSPYGQAWLLLALHTNKDARAGELAGILATRAQTKGDLAWWTSENDPLLGDWGDATADATAAAVQALAAVRPNDPLIDPALRWLMANRADGMSWASTKQTAMVLYGLLGVMQGRQERPAAVTVTVSSGGQSQSVAFTPADWTRPFPVVVTLPAAAGNNAVTITSAGGPVYWTASARYYDTAEGLERTGTRKLALSRKYFTLAPVRRNGRVVYDERPYIGTASPGDLILVRLVVAGSSDWRYLMIEDPIPAGAEAVTRPDLLELAKPPSWTYGSHREYRDDRVALFLDEMPGRAEFAYLLRVTTPGQFRAMPAQVSPMYVPGVHASSAALSLDVPSAQEPR